VRQRSHSPFIGLLAIVVLAVLPMAAAKATTSTSSPTPAVNPDLAASCGTDVTLILDRSGSIGSNKTQVQSAAQAFVTALVGTGSKVQIISFSDRATAEPGSSANLADLAFVDPAGLTVPTFPSNGKTNWDDALEMARRSPAGHAPLVVMITDGDPTTHNTVQPDGHGGAIGTSAADLDAAVSEANALKALPSHVFALGVGSAVSNAASEGRLKAISGPDKLTFTGETPNMAFGAADYTLVTEFASLKTVVSRFVRDLCGPSLNIVKMLQPANGSPAVKATGADAFSFTTTLTPPASSWRAPVQGPGATASLTTTDGVANFTFEPQTPDASTIITLAETPKAGWAFNGTKCSINNLDGTPPVEVQNNVGPNVAGTPSPANPAQLPALGPYQAMNCEVYNREVKAASVSVDKVTLPTSRPETFSFALKHGATTVGTIPALADASPAATFGPVAPGTYDVVEGASSTFDQTAATCDNLATDAHEALSAVGLVLAEGSHWQCTFTNTVHNGTVKIVKKLVDAPAGTFPFTSNIAGHTSFDLHATKATDGTMSFSVPPGTYSAAEGIHGAYTLASSCSQGSTPAAIVVTPDATTTCTFTNTAPLPTITVTKAAGTSTVAEPGGDVTYTVTATNTSVEPLTITSISDAVAGGPTINVLTLPPAKTTCGPLAGTTLAIGATATCTFKAPALGDAGATVTDTVTVTATDGDDHAASGHASASVGVTDVAPTLLVNKSTATPTIAEPAGDVTYTVVVTNTSGEGVTLTTLTDKIGATVRSLLAPSGPITTTTCSLGTIAAGGTTTCSFTAHVTGNAGDVVTDTARAVGIDNDGTSAEASDNATVAFTDVLPSISVDKTAAPGTIAEPGGAVVYTVGITNLTAEPVTLASIVDAVGAGAPAPVAGSCAALVGTTLAGHASTTCSFIASVTADAAAGSVTDTVTVKAHDDEDHTATAADSATVTVTDVLPTITVSKTPSPSSIAEPGGNVTFTVGVHNTSVEPVTIDAIVDAIGGGTPVDLATVDGTCDDLIGDSLAPGATVTCHFQLFVAGNAAAVVDDLVTVSAGDNDGNQATGTAGARVTVTDVAPHISVTKTAGSATVPEPGAPVLYTVVVHNGSVEPVVMTSLADVVGGAPAINVAAVAATTCTVPQSIPAGGNLSCTFTLPVTGDAGATVADVVTATAHDDDGNTTTANGGASVSVSDVLPAISVTKTAGVATVPEPGGPVTYTVVVHNSSVEPVALTGLSDVVGSDAAIDVSAVAGTTCALPQTIPAGGDHSCTFTLAVAGNAGHAVTDTITATASDDEQHQVTASDDASVGIADVAPTITLAKTATPSSVPEPGGPVSYSLTLTNTSVEPVTITHLTDQVGTDPAVDVTGIDGSTCHLPHTVALGGTYSCAFTLAVAGDAGAMVTDVVTATATDDDGGTTTAQAAASVSVTDVKPGITVTKTASTPSVPEPGAPVTYTATITNASPEALTVTSLSDVVGAGSAVDVSGITGTTCVLPHALPIGGSYACTFTLAVAGNAGAIVTDVATATAVDNEGNSTTGEGGAGVAVSDVLPAISVTKVAGVATVAEPGGNVTYTVTVHNDAVEPVTLSSLKDAVGDASPVDVTSVDGTTCTLPVTIPAGGDHSCTFTTAVTGNAGDTVTDVVTATGHDDDDNTVVATATASVRVSDVLPTITVNKDATTTSVSAPGGPATYVVTVTNTSPEPVSVVAITDTVQGDTLDVTKVAGKVSATTCQVPIPLAAHGDDGDTATCQFTVQLSSDEGTTATDVVTVHATDDDDNGVDGSDGATTTIVPAADLAIVKSVTGTPTIGSTGTYTLTVTNQGPSAATDVVVNDALPASLTATGATGDGWTCTIGNAGSAISCTRPTLASGASAAIVLAVTIGDPDLASGVSGTAIANTATVGSPTPDPDLTNNTSTATVVPTRRGPLPLAAVDEPAAPARGPLPKTGVDVRSWMILADVILICGVFLLFAEALPVKRRRSRS
jgi:uncharacterized repeat protein (TIGR01451 family)